MLLIAGCVIVIVIWFFVRLLRLMIGLFWLEVLVVSVSGFLYVFWVVYSGLVLLVLDIYWMTATLSSWNLARE